MTEADVIQPSASIASTGKGIRYIGTNPMHCYAFSGGFPTSTTAQTMLLFDSGSGYILGAFHLNAECNFATIGGGYSAYQISFNDVVVAIIKTGSASDDQQAYSTMEILIPPFTNVKVEADSTNNTGANTLTVTFAGRVYGAA